MEYDNDNTNSNHDLIGVNSLVRENSRLSPKEAFHKFDTDGSGTIEEDEFFHLLECVGIPADCEYQERMFKRFANPGSNCIDYDGFRKAWVLLGNPKQQLIDRDIKEIPKFATRRQFVSILEQVLDEEERLDKLAKAEAERFQRLQEERNIRAEFIRKAKAQAGSELALALDAAGCCYVLGTGTNNAFSSKAKTNMFSFSSFQQVGSDLLQTLWDERVQVMIPSDVKPPNNITAGIWGRQPSKIALAKSSIFALTDCGIMAWGGSENWKEVLESDGSTDDTRPQSPCMTPRSATLLMNDKQTKIKHLEMITEEAEEKETKSTREIQQLKQILKYYGKLPHKLEDHKKLSDYVHQITYDQILCSLELRGKHVGKNGFSKPELISLLSSDISLEEDVLGEEGHQIIRGIEREIEDLRSRGKMKAASRLKLQMTETWAGLQAEQNKQKIEAEGRVVREKLENRAKLERDFERWYANRIAHGMTSMAVTAGGNNIERPRGVSQCIDISSGSHHSAIIFEGGKLYSWGMGSLGRLGLSKTDFSDRNRLQHVKELKGSIISNISCGNTHSAAVSDDGRLFLWGGSNSSQLGFGQFSDSREYCCPIPTQLIIPSCKGIIRVSCGFSHTACVGRSGEVYVWGCGDGGRLGLGRLATLHEPIIVEKLLHERIVDVSCGCFQTLALTAIDIRGFSGPNSIEQSYGGRLYVAGPKNVLGTSCPSFSLLPSLQGNEHVVKQISAGYSHQSFVTQSGELFCWGSNLHGCCGQNERLKFIPNPTKVDWMYESNINLALEKPCLQSSYYMDSSGLSSRNGVDGRIEGNDTKALVHTQYESCPYWEVDLESFSHITQVELWNRTDEPDDDAMGAELFRRRLFPCWIMISQVPLPKSEEGNGNLRESLRLSCAVVRVSKNQRLSKWDVPPFTIGRFVRIQLEGTNFLHFAQVKVFGHLKLSHGPVSHCAAGNHVTAAVVAGLYDAGAKERAYKRAISADWYNAEILRQLVSYSDEYTKHNFNDVKLADCILCVGNEKCNICALKTKFQNELKSFRCNDLRRLDDIADFLFHQVDRDEGSTTKRNNFIPQIRLPLSVPVDESDEEFDKSEAASIEQSKAPSALSRLKERFNRRFWGRNIMFAKRM